jgi:GT2 family glycosyltransferase
MEQDTNFPPITVVTSVFNKAEIVEKCISSLLAVDYPDFSILVIEQFSTDGSWEILQKFAGRIRLLRVSGNHPIALNRAFDELDTPLVALTDADCTVERDWLKELSRGFSEDREIVAVSGLVRTGKGLSTLATLIGIEVEERFTQFPKYLPRASTQNLCIRTETARQVRFDERLRVALETDFGYRITKIGKMLYNPRAVVYHYNRSTWRGFFKQQVGYARGAFWVYLRHVDRLKGDHISTFSMILQIPLFLSGVACLILAAWERRFLFGTAVAWGILFALYVRDTVRLPIAGRRFPVMAAIFIVRTVAWTVGAFRALYSFATLPFRRRNGGDVW